MKRRIVMVVVLLSFPIVVLADEKKPDQARVARELSAYVDDQVLAVVHLDLVRLDPAAVLERVAALANPAAPLGQEAEARVMELRKLRSAFLKAGGQRLFVLFSLAEVQSGTPLLIIPLERNADTETLTNLLREPVRSVLPEGIVEKQGDALVAGSKTMVERQRGLKPGDRPELAQALAATEDAPCQLLVLPGRDVRRVVEELLPELPKAVGGSSIQPLTRGLRWAAAAGEVKPALAFRLTVQAADADSARALRAIVGQGLQTLGREKGVREVYPEFDRIAEQLTPRTIEDRLTLTLEEKLLVSTLVPVIAQVRGSAERSRIASNLRQIGIAFHSWFDTHKLLPAVARFDKQGKPLLSWRVLLLPYVGEEQLYKEFRLDEPWDSNHNRKLIPRIPAVYRSANARLTAEGKTTLLVPVSKLTMFAGGPKGIHLIKDVPDGTSNTILLIESDEDHAVVWTRPEDLRYDMKDPRAGLAKRVGVIPALFVDGSVRFLPADIEPRTLHALFTRMGGEAVSVP